MERSWRSGRRIALCLLNHKRIETYHWISHGGDEHEVESTSEAPETGTDITLTLKPEFGHFLREMELARTIQLFADFLFILCLLSIRSRGIAEIRGLIENGATPHPSRPRRPVWMRVCARASKGALAHVPGRRMPTSPT